MKAPKAPSIVARSRPKAPTRRAHDPHTREYLPPIWWLLFGICIGATFTSLLIHFHFGV
jgi:hypothetical protein